MRRRAANPLVGLALSSLVLASLAGLASLALGGPAASTGPLASAVGGGWGPREVVSTQPSVPDLADVAVGPDGEMAAIWATDGVTRIALRDTDGTWLPPKRLSSASYPQATYPRVAYDGTGRLTAAWLYGIQGSEMYVEYRRTRPDGNWGGTQIVGQWDYGYYSKLDLVANADGDLLLGWLTRKGVYLADKAGTHYPISKTVRHVEAFDVALSDNGLRVAVLARDDGTSQTLSVIRKQAGGTWSTAEVLWTGAEPGNTLPTPGSWVDATGTATVVWRQPAAGGTWDLVAARAAEGAAWSAPEVLRANAGLGPTLVRGTPGGDVLVVYRRHRGKVEAVRYAGGWGEPALVGAADPAVKDLAAAMDSGGRAVALFSPQVGGLGAGVVSRVMTPGGVWRPAVRLLRSGQKIARGSLQAGAGHGDLLAAWSQRRADGTFVVVARVHPAG